MNAHQPTKNRRKPRKPKPDSYWQRRARERRAEVRARRLDRHGAGVDSTLTWFVVQTASHMESRAADDLFEAGFGTFLPEHSVTEIRSGWKLGEKRQRKVEIERPFFPGYLFVGLVASDLAFARVTAADGVVGLVLFDGVPCEIDAELLTRIKERIDAKRSAKQRAAAELAWKLAKRLPTHDLRLGQEAKVTAGMFEGFFAQVIALIGSDQVKVSLSAPGARPSAKITATMPVDILKAA